MIETKEIDKTFFEDDTSLAPSLVLGIEEDDPTRGLSGTVFEDSNIVGENPEASQPGYERMGNGILDDEDKNRIYNVKVELFEADEDNPGDFSYKTDADGNKVPIHATLYKLSVDDRGHLSTTTEPAVTYTDENGDYSFIGVIPGRYLIRYTYDNKCYIVKPDSNYSYNVVRGDNREEEQVTVKDAEGAIVSPINVRDYKSTIIVSDLMKVALNLKQQYSSEKERMGDLNWILKYDAVANNNNYTDDARSKSKDLDNLIKYSDAADDISKRDEMDDLYFGTYGNNYLMTADTAFFEVGVEYSEVGENNTDGFSKKISFTQYKDEYNLDGDKIVVLDENGRIKVIDTFYAVNPYQDFGIVERARQDFEINKRVSNLKILLASGQVLVNGNPYKQNPENFNEIEAASDDPLPYVKAVPGMVVAEIDNEILQGATLSVEYTITIINRSEIDYQYKEDQRYYYYGTNPQEMVITTIRKVVDYMEDDLDYDEIQNEVNWKKVEPEQLLKWKDDDNPTLEKQLIANGETVNGKSYNVYEGIKSGYTVAVTEYFYEHGIPYGESESVKIYGSKLLSTREEGVTIKNHVEIIETEGIRSIFASIPGNYNPKDEAPDEQDDDMTTLVITPPTGLFDNKIFIVSITTIVLAVLASGIYLIKKKVLD